MTFSTSNKSQFHIFLVFLMKRATWFSLFIIGFWMEILTEKGFNLLTKQCLKKYFQYLMTVWNGSSLLKPAQLCAGIFFSRFFNISIYNVMSKTTSIMYKTQNVSSLKTAFQYVGWRGEGYPTMWPLQWPEYPTPLPVDRQTPMKTLPSPTFVENRRTQ